MKRSNFAAFLFAALLSLSLSCSTALGLATGFDLPVENPHWVAAVCAFASLGCSILFQLRQGKILFLLLSFLLGSWLWYLQLPVQQLLATIQSISTAYNNAYHWGVPNFSTAILNADYPLMAIGYLAAAGVSYWSATGRGLVPALAAVLLPLSSCFVVTDTVPDAHFLFLIFVGCGIIVLTASVRRHSIRQGNRLAAMTALPMLAAGAALFLLIPQDGYVSHAPALRQQLTAWVQTLPRQLENGISTLSSSIDRNTPETINLAALAGQSLSSAPVMTVTAQSSGTLYLRGQDYDRYTGTGWISDTDRAESFTPAAAATSEISIRTRRVQDVLFVPYYPAAELSLLAGSVPNREQLQEYQFPVGSVSVAPNGQQDPFPEAERYLALPEDTALRASNLLATILPESDSHSEKASAIGAYVRSSAAYDLNPGAMPSAEEDFALWFLENADRGYCVHFATASVVLLRAAGIPARYVTGYMTTIQSGIPSTVTEKSAHAWAEYYDTQLNVWRILESTPAGGSEETVPTTPAPERQDASTPPVPEETASIETSTAPSMPNSGAADWTWAKSIAKVLAGVGCFLFAAVLQHRVRLALRHRKQTQGERNTQALERWQETQRLSRLLKQPPTEELLALAQKAKFSQHDLTPEELLQFDSYLRSCRQQLEQKPLYIRLIHQYIFAAY